MESSVTESTQIEDLFNNSWQSVKDYIKRQLYVNPVSKDGKTLLHRAVNEPSLEMVLFLLANGNIDINAQDNSGRTALHDAIMWGNELIFQALMNDTRIQVNIADKDGWTPLHEAARFSRLSMVEKLLKVSKINLNAVTLEGLTPLEIARKNGQRATEKMLVLKLSGKEHQKLEVGGTLLTIITDYEAQWCK